MEKSCKTCKYFLAISHICSNPNAEEAATCVQEDHCCHVYKIAEKEEQMLNKFFCR